MSNSSTLTEYYHDLMTIQQDDLLRWRRKLNAECYDDLCAFVHEANMHVDCRSQVAIRATVTRGDSLTEFICNWKPSA